MSWQASARAAVQRIGVQPRYLRRLRWIAKARAVRQAGAPMREHLGYVLAGCEPDNFTYELRNQAELVRWVAEVAGCAERRVSDVFAEGRDDPVLAERVRAATARRRWWTKRSPPFGKRLAWYALTRLRKPALVIETGVHDGLGSLILLRALERNYEENGGGRLVSFDINPAAGWMVGSHPLWEMRVEAAVDGLTDVLADSDALGIFIHDSLHTYENEAAELALAARALAHDGVLISDNAHASSALLDTCRQLGLHYFQFQERPEGHFYGGGAIGAGRRAESPAASTSS
jgi:predicted O-methyltransferase YrrM